LSRFKTAALSDDPVSDLRGGKWPELRFVHKVQDRRMHGQEANNASILQERVLGSADMTTAVLSVAAAASQ
jgi:hypothetical protein